MKKNYVKIVMFACIFVAESVTWAGPLCRYESLEHKIDWSNVNKIIDYEDFSAPALVHASSENKSDLVERLLVAMANPNCEAGCGMTPLRAAIICGHVENVRLLLQHKADVNLQCRAMLGNNHGSYLAFAHSLEGTRFSSGTAFSNRLQAIITLLQNRN